MIYRIFYSRKGYDQVKNNELEYYDIQKNNRISLLVLFVCAQQ